MAADTVPFDDADCVQWWNAMSQFKSEVSISHFAASFAIEFGKSWPTPVLFEIVEAVIARDSTMTGPTKVSAQEMIEYLQKLSRFKTCPFHTTRALFDPSGHLQLWYHGAIDLDQSLARLASRCNCFLVRNSSERPDQFLLEYRTQHHVKGFRVFKSKHMKDDTQQWVVEGENDDFIPINTIFRSLCALVRHIRVLMPVPSDLFLMREQCMPVDATLWTAEYERPLQLGANDCMNYDEYVDQRSAIAAVARPPDYPAPPPSMRHQYRLEGVARVRPPHKQGHVPPDVVREAIEEALRTSSSIGVAFPLPYRRPY